MSTEPSRHDSITVWFDQLNAGDPEAAAKLWNRFFDRLVEIARQQMAVMNRRVVDEEDIAIGVMAALCECAKRGKLPTVQNRDDLWQQLLSWLKHDVIDQLRLAGSAKRGANQVRGDSVFRDAGNGRWNEPRGFEQIAEQVATPAVLVEMEEQFRVLLHRLPEPALREITIFKMEGYTNDEIAEKMGVSSRTVDRKLKLIRSFWSSN